MSYLIDIANKSAQVEQRVTKMFNLLTVTASFLTVYLVVEFVMGLVQLWNQSGNASVLTPDLTGQELRELTEVTFKDFGETIAALPEGFWDFKSEALLPQAVEVDDSIYDATATLESQSIRQLKALAKERGLKKYSYLTKVELIKALYELG